ncbi:hypothetical protein FS749_011305 [Ceratobasidium sp. UAMH 11750]|nr:hypothetical protein FS749_011305 [Ceratobasidium sp. UAMH 11750]
MSPSCPACIRLVVCPAHRPASRSHASDTGPSLSTLPLSSQVQHLDPLTSKIGASAPTPLISFSSSKSIGLKAPIISARAKAKHADAAARASHGPLSKRQKKRLKKASHAHGRKSANDVWIYFRSTNAARTPVGANIEDICTEDSAYQVSQPFSQFQCPKDGKYLRCALCL